MRVVALTSQEIGPTLDSLFGGESARANGAVTFVTLVRCFLRRRQLVSTSGPERFADRVAYDYESQKRSSCCRFGRVSRTITFSRSHSRRGSVRWTARPLRRSCWRNSKQLSTRRATRFGRFWRALRVTPGIPWKRCCRIIGCSVRVSCCMRYADRCSPPRFQNPLRHARLWKKCRLLPNWPCDATCGSFLNSRARRVKSMLFYASPSSFLWFKSTSGELHAVTAKLTGRPWTPDPPR